MTKYVITIRPISLGRLTKVLGYSDIPHSRFAIFKLWIRKFYLLSIISILSAFPFQVGVKMYCSKNMPMGKTHIYCNCFAECPNHSSILISFWANIHFLTR